jgi:hypothetical protein
MTDLTLKNLKPFRQGNLDRFCAIYTLFNAINFAAREIVIDQQEAGSVFAHLIVYATLNHTKEVAPFTGIKANEFLQLAHVARLGLSNSGSTFRFRDPIRTLRKAPDEVPTKRTLFKRALKLEGAALIVRVRTFDCNHWSVLAGVKGAKVDLFDSAGINRVELGTCKPWRLVTF